MIIMMVIISVLRLPIQHLWPYIQHVMCLVGAAALLKCMPEIQISYCYLASCVSLSPLCITAVSCSMVGVSLV